MTDRVLVLGSNSFTGAHLVAEALRQGCEVLGVSRSPEPHRVFLPYRWADAPGRFTFRQLDLNHDLDAILSAVDDFRPDHVINFASQSMVAESWAHPEHWMSTNVVATVKLHDGLRRRPFLRKYVHVSTPEVYGACQGLVPEHTQYNPSTPYAVSRAAADLSLMTFHRNYGFPVTFTRAANVYGPGQQLYRIVPRAVLFFLTGRTLQLHGGGRSVRSFIHAEDVARATLAVARDGAPGGILHLSTTLNVSIRELVELVARRLGVRFEDHVEIVADRPGKDAAYLLDSARARRELGWEPRISLEEGLDQTIAWVRTHQGELLAQPLDYVHKP
ncbi:MAG: GDP-mannose 4,6-dehydratase [Anaeromyxobacter sp.]